MLPTVRMEVIAVLAVAPRTAGCAPCHFAVQTCAYLRPIR